MRGLPGKGLAAVAVAAVLAVGAGSVRAQPAGDYDKVLKDRSAAFVTIKFVLKLKMGGMGESETEAEITGAMIDPKGLVICSNTQLGGMGGVMRSLGREVSATPTDIKVLAGEDTEGLEARLIARDTELDLAWVQVKQPGQRKFDYVDLRDGTDGKVGQPVVTVRRMAKFFDRVPVIGESRVAGVARKPRRLYVPTLPLTSNLGLPVFATDGKVLGVAVLQMPSDEDQDEGPAAMFSRMSSLQDMMSGVILPAADVIDATKRARQTAATQPADAEEPPAAPKAEPQKAGQKAAPKARPRPTDSEDEE